MILNSQMHYLTGLRTSHCAPQHKYHMTFAGGVLFTIGLYKEDAMVVSTNNIKTWSPSSLHVMGAQSMQIAGSNHIFK